MKYEKVNVYEYLKENPQAVISFEPAPKKNKFVLFFIRMKTKINDKIWKIKDYMKDRKFDKMD